MKQYVLIVVPPKDILELIEYYRKKYAKYTGYAIVSHLTIYPPFYIPSDNESEIVKILEKEFSGTRSGVVRIKKIGFFEGGNNVVFFEPDGKSTRFLKRLLIKITDSLGERVKNVYEDYNFEPEKFRPHMTIAERIPSEDFDVVKQELGNLDIKISFDVSSICLYSAEDKDWKKVSKIDF